MWKNICLCPEMLHRHLWSCAESPSVPSQGHVHSFSWTLGSELQANLPPGFISPASAWNAKHLGISQYTSFPSPPTPAPQPVSLRVPTILTSECVSNPVHPPSPLPWPPKPGPSPFWGFFLKHKSNLVPPPAYNSLWLSSAPKKKPKL